MDVHEASTQEPGAGEFRPLKTIFFRVQET